jgi:DNA modification methylase
MVIGKQTTTIWQFPKASPKKQREGFYCAESMSHPAKMPTYLAQAIIATYTEEGDSILDPMTGIGTTVIESSKLMRNAVGIEYEKRFLEICSKNLTLTKEKLGNRGGRGMFIQGDARKLSEIVKLKFDGIVFSPPFANTLAGSSKDDVKKFKHGSAGKDYGDRTDPGQIGNLTHRAINIKEENTYSGEMFKVYSQCYSVLKPRGFMILVVKNFRRKGEEINLVNDTIHICKAAGFKLFQTCIHVLNGASFWQINHVKKTPYLMLNLTEYILVFRKD